VYGGDAPLEAVRRTGLADHDRGSFLRMASWKKVSALQSRTSRLRLCAIPWTTFVLTIPHRLEHQRTNSAHRGSRTADPVPDGCTHHTL